MVRASYDEPSRRVRAVRPADPDAEGDRLGPLEPTLGRTDPQVAFSAAGVVGVVVGGVPVPAP